MNAITLFLKGNNVDLKGSLAESERVVNQFANKVGNTFKTLFAAYIGGQVVGKIKEAFHAFAEEEVGVIKLARAIELSGRSVEETTRLVDGLVSELQGLTRFGDDQTREAARLAINMGVTNDQMRDQIRLAADLAEHLGTNLPGAMQMLTRMAAYPQMAFRMLRQTGIQFTESEQEQIKALIKAGQTMEANAIIMDKLRAKVSGLAQEIGDSPAGKLQKMANAVDDLKESWGALFAMIESKLGVLDTMTGIAKTISGVIGGGSGAPSLVSASGQPETFDEAQRKIRALRADQGTMQSELKVLESQMHGWATMFIPLKGIANAVENAQTQNRIDEIRKQMDEVNSELARLQDQFKDRDMQRDVIDPLTEMRDSMVGEADKLGKELKESLGDGLTSAFNTVTGIVGNIPAQAVRGAQKKFEDDLKKFRESSKTARQTFEDEMKELDRFRDELSPDQVRLAEAKIKKNFEDAKKSEEELLNGPAKMVKGFTATIEDVVSANRRITSAAASMPDREEKQIQAIRQVEKALTPLGSVASASQTMSDNIQKLVDNQPLVGALA